MRVAMISRQTLFSSPGGDTTQILETAAGLRLLGVHVDIFLAADAVDYAQYDLIHFFNIIRPADILRHAGMNEIPYLISTIYVEYGQEHAPDSLQGRLHRYFGADGIEYLKVIGRRVRNGDQIGSARYLLFGHRSAVRKAARGAAMLLPNSYSEYRRFVSAYGIERPYLVVPNGISTEKVLTAVTPDARYAGSVVCMGRIEPRKNQLRLIQALRGEGIRLFIHGKAAPNHSAYYDACVAASDAFTVFGGQLDAPALYSAYAGAAVHALPSFFETTGLSSLEAAAMGCQIVVTDRGDQLEYFENYAEYCDPLDTISIRDAVRRALRRPKDTSFRQIILDKYTWERAAAATFDAYTSVLKTKAMRPDTSIN